MNLPSFGNGVLRYEHLESMYDREWHSFPDRDTVLDSLLSSALMSRGVVVNSHVLDFFGSRSAYRDSVELSANGLFWDYRELSNVESNRQRINELLNLHDGELQTYLNTLMSQFHQYGPSTEMDFINSRLYYDYRDRISPGCFRREHLPRNPFSSTTNFRTAMRMLETRYSEETEGLRATCLDYIDRINESLTHVIDEGIRVLADAGFVLPSG